MKPCPFCGEEVDLETGHGTPDREGVPVYVLCATCGAQGPWRYCPTVEDDVAAVEAWDTRM